MEDSTPSRSKRPVIVCDVRRSRRVERNCWQSRQLGRWCAGARLPARSTCCQRNGHICKGATRQAAAGPTPCAPHVEPWGSSSMSGRVSSQLTTPSLAAGRARLAAPSGGGPAEALRLAGTAACTPSTRLLSPRAPPPGARASSEPVSWDVVEGVGGDGGRRRWRRRVRRCVPRPHRAPRSLGVPAGPYTITLSGGTWYLWSPTATAYGGGGSRNQKSGGALSANSGGESIGPSAAAACCWAKRKAYSRHEQLTATTTSSPQNSDPMMAAVIMLFLRHPYSSLPSGQSVTRSQTESSVTHLPSPQR